MLVVVVHFVCGIYGAVGDTIKAVVRIFVGERWPGSGLSMPTYVMYILVPTSYIHVNTDGIASRLIYRNVIIQKQVLDSFENVHEILCYGFGFKVAARPASGYATGRHDVVDISAVARRSLWICDDDDDDDDAA